MMMNGRFFCLTIKRVAGVVFWTSAFVTLKATSELFFSGNFRVYKSTLETNTEKQTAIAIRYRAVRKGCPPSARIQG